MKIDVFILSLAAFVVIMATVVVAAIVADWGDDERSWVEFCRSIGADAAPSPDGLTVCIKDGEVVYP